MKGVQETMLPCKERGEDELFITITAGGKDAYAVLTALGDIGNPHTPDPPLPPKQITVTMIVGPVTNQ